MGIVKGHQIKILKKIKEQFDEQSGPSIQMPRINRVNYDQQQISPSLQHDQDKANKKEQKVMVEMGYGDGNVNDYADIEALQQERLLQGQNYKLSDQPQTKSDDQEQNIRQQANDVVMLTVPMSQISLQTGQTQMFVEVEGGFVEQVIAQNCFNCYRTIPLGQSYISPDSRQFCSGNCLKMYKLQMQIATQKTCPECDQVFFRTTGYYDQGLWFCSLKCSPNKEEVDEMFLEWASSRR